MKIMPPKFFQEPAPFLQEAAALAQTDERAEGLKFHKLSFAGLRLADREFSECVFTACDLNGAF